MLAAIERRAAFYTLALYKPPSYMGVKFDFISADPQSSVYYGLVRDSLGTYLICRGTANVLDAFHDVLFLAVNVPKLGPVHHGFNLGTQDAWVQIKTALPTGPAPTPLIIAGHSLGAAHATQIAAYAVADGRPPLARILFGEPKSGFQTLTDLLALVPTRSYINGNDPVPCYPLDIPGLLPYERSSAHDTRILRAPIDDDPWPGPMAYHHMEYYYGALANVDMSPL